MPFGHHYLTAGDVLRLDLLVSVLAVVVGLVVAHPYGEWLGQPLLSPSAASQSEALNRHLAPR